MARFYVVVQLLLVVGTKLEHVITQLAHEVAEKHVAVKGDVVVQPSDSLFWFNQPKCVLFFYPHHPTPEFLRTGIFLLVQYGFHACIIGKVGYVIPRVDIGAFVQFVCSYSPLTLYALVTQMGGSFQNVIFEKHIQQGLAGWAKQAKKNVGLRNGVSAATASPLADQIQELNGTLQLDRVVAKEREEIVHQTDSG